MTWFVFQVSDLQFPLRSALENNKPNFVNLFLDMGWFKQLILLDFDTRSLIKDLYKKVSVTFKICR